MKQQLLYKMNLNLAISFQVFLLSPTTLLHLGKEEEKLLLLLQGPRWVDQRMEEENKAAVSYVKGA